jgi:hypothetical protein
MYSVVEGDDRSRAEVARGREIVVYSTASVLDNATVKRVYCLPLDGANDRVFRLFSRS